MKAFIDSDILIWHLRGEKKALRLLKKLHDIEKYELWTGAMQRSEVIFFMRPQEEDDTLLFFNSISDSACKPEDCRSGRRILPDVES